MNNEMQKMLKLIEQANQLAILEEYWDILFGDFQNANYHTIDIPAFHLERKANLEDIVRDVKMAILYKMKELPLAEVEAVADEVCIDPDYDEGHFQFEEF